MTILDAYVLTEPTSQNILDIFKGEWSSAMPTDSGLSNYSAVANLFEDPRLAWANDTLGGFAEKNVLELGPLEGGHSYMLHNIGAARVLGVEANSRAFLKCLCIKEIFKLDRASFLLGSFMPFLATTTERYDAVIASGILYHMDDPLYLLSLISSVTDKMYLWTHYYNADIVTNDPNLAHKFDPPQVLVRDGHAYEWVKQHYKDALEWDGFCGGTQATSFWLTRESLISYLKTQGYQQISINFEEPAHPNGPCLAICAQR